MKRFMTVAIVATMLLAASMSFAFGGGVTGTGAPTINPGAGSPPK
jgi:hypothetical protein